MTYAVPHTYTLRRTNTHINLPLILIIIYPRLTYNHLAKLLFPTIYVEIGVAFYQLYSKYIHNLYIANNKCFIIKFIRILHLF